MEKEYSARRLAVRSLWASLASFSLFITSFWVNAYGRFFDFLMGMAPVLAIAALVAAVVGLMMKKTDRGMLALVMACLLAGGYGILYWLLQGMCVIC